MFEDHMKDIGTVNKSENSSPSKEDYIDESPVVEEFTESSRSEPQR